MLRLAGTSSFKWTSWRRIKLVSAYEILTVADLQNYTGDTYVNLSAKYTDTVIETWISQAERWIFDIVGTIYTLASVPGNVLEAIKLLASRIAHNNTIPKTVSQISAQKQRIRLIDDDLLTLLETTKRTLYIENG